MEARNNVVSFSSKLATKLRATYKNIILLQK